MSTPLRLVASLVVSVAATAGGSVAALGQDRPEGWLVDTVRFEPLDAGDAALAVEGLNHYRGTVEFRNGRSGVTVINEVGLEDYVRGIVEVPPTWPAEALKAQAIAARTYALNQRSSAVSSPWRDAGAHLCATDACQVYLGLAGEQREHAGAWVAAVEATAGEALLLNGRPILAEYSSSNGGRSVPGGAPYLRAVNDPDDSHSPQSRWRYSLPLDQLAALAGVEPPASLAAISRSGDTIVASIRPPEGEPIERTMSAADFVSAANSRLPAPAGHPLPFPSYRFSLSSEGGEALVDGRGWGHGRGMSQWGAYGKARRGMDASDILAAYYGGIRPEPLSDEQRSLPVRVAVATGQRRGAVAGSGLFRVTGDEGSVLASVALGRWTVVPERGRLRVLPPDDFAQPLALSTPQLDPARPLAGARPTVQFTVSAPAVVTVRLRGPGLDGDALPPVLVESGEANLRLPRTRFGGDHDLLIEAEAGPGRRATAQLRFPVQGQAVYEASLPDGQRGRHGLIALACLLAAAAGTGALAQARSQPSHSHSTG